MKIFKNLSRKLSLFGELGDYLLHNKKWWLGPPIVILLLFGLLLALTEGSVVAPFIYTLF